jgi:hypothetical protein
MKVADWLWPIVVCLLSALCGCQGVPMSEIRAQAPVFVTTSQKDAGTIVTCLTNTEVFDELADRVHILSLPDQRKQEIAIGAVQAGKFKSHYLVTLTNVDRGAAVEIRRSTSYYAPLSPDELKAAVTTCASGA